MWLSLLKACLELYQTLILCKIYVKTSVKYRFCYTNVSGFLGENWKKKLQSGVLISLTKYLS